MFNKNPYKKKCPYVRRIISKYYNESKLITFPVKRSQSRPSGNGSPPGMAVGNTFWHSGIERPLKRIP